MEEVLVVHLKASDRGQAPVLQELLAHYPEFAAEVPEFLANRA